MGITIEDTHLRCLKKPARKERWDKVDGVVYMEETILKLTAFLNNIQDMPNSLVTDRVNIILSGSALSAGSPLPKKEDYNYHWYSAFRPMARNVTDTYKELARVLISQQQNSPANCALDSEELLGKAHRQAAIKCQADISLK